MKKKSLSLLLSGLLTVCLTGVGFASWLIVEGDTEDQIAGTVNVETISNVKTEITYSWANNAGETANVTTGDNKAEYDNMFSFGAPASIDNKGWLRNTGGIKECLSLTLNVSISNPTYLAGGTIKLDVNSTDRVENGVTKSGYDWAVDRKYITKFKLSQETLTAGVGTYEIVISTTWGEYFDTNNGTEGATVDTNTEDNLNPYTYYNNRTSADYAADANTTLTNLQNYISSLTFKLTITATV